VSTYVVGDLQGCFHSLRALLREVEWHPERDEVWLAGDVVNRGPDSLACLRWGREHARHCVLGNHDLHLLAVAAGVREEQPGDTLSEILGAPDLEELLSWLRQRPLLVEERVGGEPLALVHAGLLPSWTFELAAEWARAAEAELRGAAWARFLERLYTKAERRRDPLLAAVRAMTMVRTVDAQGEPLRKFKGHPDQRPKGSEAWFLAPGRRWSGRVVFGHWAALGLRVEEHAVGLDAGCVWGGSLAALRLEDGVTFSVPNSEPRRGEMRG
jgi:bis(5'-nucleosyl)-tetraphosphatase (symmetrical)